MTAFTVKQQSFEGPLDLLLDLIERRQMHINDIALAKVADDFLSYAKGFTNFPLAEGSHFALIASSLLLIKSKSLLPMLALSEEEEGGIADLEHRLKLLQRFRELSKHIRTQFCRAPLHLPNEREAAPLFSPPKTLTKEMLCFAARAVLAALPKIEPLATAAIKKIMSLKEMIENLKERITAALRISFREFTGANRGEKISVIVSFLALLELVKQGLISVTQEEARGDILMETAEIETPRY